MSIPSPLKQYHFHAILIWCTVPLTAFRSAGGWQVFADFFLNYSLAFRNPVMVLADFGNSFVITLAAFGKINRKRKNFHRTS